ncbi:shikimate kinase [Rhodococcus sp. HNM0569]|uniref:shikimate kinase n=1 Tax=Rhodococcus sp. HNM0569 TaxID=2716340 RepID=UPI001469FE92|nr:shikimate kinase [Rhodococcus sp. HNM0569]
MAPRAVLIGPPGAGKSTIGRRLAHALDVPLFDTDVAIEERLGVTIPEYFASHGEPAFREVEEDVVAHALAEHSGVVSLGGGAVLSERTRALLGEHVVVYLEISVAEGLRRTKGNTGRPLLAGGDHARKYHQLMRIRRPLYREVATVRVRTDARSPARVVQQVLTRLEALASDTDRPGSTPPSNSRPSGDRPQHTSNEVERKQ